MSFFGFFKRHKVIFFDALILFGLMLLFFMRWIFKERYTLFTSDVVQDFSMHHFVAQSWSKGEIPLWDPYFTWAIAGYLNSGIFYPFNLLMDLLHSFVIDNLNLGYLLMEANAFSHYFLASFFMYLLVRNFGISRLAAIIAGITFAYSGYMVKEYVHLAYLQGAVWLPLVFLFFYKSIFLGKIKYAILAGIFFAISLLAGQTQPAIYYVFLIIVFVTYSLFYFSQTKEVRWQKPIVAFIVFILVSFGLFAIQFFPTKEYAKYSTRSNLSYAESVGYSANPLYFVIHPFIPSFWGTMESSFWDGVQNEALPLNDRPKWLDTMFGGLPNEMNFYIGLLPLLLFPFALFAKNKFLRNFFLILLLVSTLLLLSRSINVIGQLFYYILGGAARVPVRASFLWSFALAFLAALGLQAIIDFKEEKKEIFEKITKVNFLILGALAFIFLPALIVLMLSAAGTSKMPYFYFPMVDAFALFMIYFLIYSLLLFFLIRARNLRLILFSLTLFFILDLFSFHANNSYIIPGNSPEIVLGKRDMPEISYLKNDKDFFRVTGLGLTAYANNLFSLGYGTTGSSGFAYRPPLELYSIITDEASPILDLLNVKYIYAPEGKLRDLASSVAATTFLSDHRPYDAFDGNAETEWVVDPKMKKEDKDWIGVTFRQPETISRVEFLGRDNDLDKEIKDLEIVFSDGASQKITLPTKKGWKVVDIKPMQTNWLKFIVNDFDLSGGKNDSYGLKEINIINSAGQKVAIGSPKFQKIEGTNLFLNKTVLPRVFTTYAYRSFKDRNEMFTAMLADQTGQEMRQNVFLYRRILGFSNPSTLPTVPSPATITEYKNKKVTVEVNMAAPGFLVLGDIWFPGWKAYLDGKETNLFSAYHVLRAVQVPAGKHTVVFNYDPLSFKIGATITLVTFGFLVVYFLLSAFVKRSKQ